MSYKVRMSRQADRDIENVLARSLAQFGEQQRRAYKALILEALADIAADPFAPPARHRPEPHPDARMFRIARRGRHARHFFVYRVVDGRFIDVGRLLHDSMDLHRHLPKGFGPPRS
jgi:toxin ParE1/3/4